MTLFSIFGGLLVVISLAFVIVPLWRNRVSHEGSRKQANVSLYEQQVKEIEAAVAEGRLSSEQAKAQQDEFAERLLEDVDAIKKYDWVLSKKGTGFITFIVIASFLLLSVFLYSQLGDMRGLQDHDNSEVVAALEKLENHIQKHPDDIQALALLARVQLSQRNFAAASETLHNINTQLDEPNLTFSLGEARALIVSHEGNIDDRASMLLEQALELDPNNPEALWYGGLSALSNGQDKVAIKRWQRLLKQDIDPGFRQRVEQRLSELKGQKPQLGPN